MVIRNVRGKPFVLLVMVVVLSACGGRTGLRGESDARDASNLDDGSVAGDAGLDATSDSGVPATVVLFGEANMPAGIAVAGGDVYWADHGDGKIMKCPVAGCGGAPTVVASGQGGVFGVAVDSVNVYWTNDGDNDVMRCALTGCNGAPTLVASAPQGLNWPFELAVDSANLYWSEGASVVACAKSGCGGQPTVLAASPNPFAIATSSTAVFWMNAGTVNADGTLMTCVSAGCGGSATSLASGQNDKLDLAADETNVYWGNCTDNTLRTCGVGGCNGAPTVLSTSPACPGSIALDDTTVYFTTGTMVLKCAKSGCNGHPTVLSDSASSPFGLALDATSVYWTNYVAPWAVMKTLK